MYKIGVLNEKMCNDIPKLNKIKKNEYKNYS